MRNLLEKWPQSWLWIKNPANAGILSFRVMGSLCLIGGIAILLKNLIESGGVSGVGPSFMVIGLLTLALGIAAKS